ncbi:hypothetical protein VitviT2T_022197 [Vitis vinifera]|uniref:Uncharacterized protein n=1 Tax=Vitis vinifera TaxID=29760 RepID=A0ABY9D9W1_VITVI|nr:hypothetical protein VitviT2T_022197 [Vitis vinifera]
MELVGMYVNTDSNEQDGENTEVDDSVNQNGNPTGTHVPKLHHPCPCRWEKENLPPKFVGEWVGLIFLVKKEMNDAKLRDKEDSRFEGEERVLFPLLWRLTKVGRGRDGGLGTGGDSGGTVRAVDARAVVPVAWKQPCGRVRQHAD